MTQVYTDSNARTVENIVMVVNPVQTGGFLSRFLPSVQPVVEMFPPQKLTTSVPETLDPIERQRLMEACLNECRAVGASLIVDWLEADRINDRIREATARSELVSLLARYKAVLCGGQKI